jgi:hypothetical protein
MEYVILFLRIICYCLDALRHGTLYPTNVWNPTEWVIAHSCLFIFNCRNSDTKPNKEVNLIPPLAICLYGALGLIILTFGRQVRKNGEKAPCPKKRANIFRCTDPVADIVLCMEYVILFLRIICYCLDALGYLSFIQQMYRIRLNELLHIPAFLYSIIGIRYGNRTKRLILYCRLQSVYMECKAERTDVWLHWFWLRRFWLRRFSIQFNSIQIVALQENPFNTKGTKCITKDTKNFLCKFCGFFALKILEHKNLIST